MNENQLLSVMARNILVALNRGTDPQKIYTCPPQAQRLVADALGQMIDFCYAKRITPDFFIEKEKHNMDKYLDFVDQAFANDLGEHLVNSGELISIEQFPAPSGTSREYTAMIVRINKLKRV
jgi:hypothetical protein